MNTLESYVVDTPFGDMGECAYFTIDDVANPFTLHDIMTHGQVYTISLWVKTPTEGSVGKLIIQEVAFDVTSDWTKYIHTFTANGLDLDIFFAELGMYCIYHPQLERGNMATDWAESPLDVNEKLDQSQNTADKANTDLQAFIKVFEDTIQNFVTNGEGETLVTLSSEGGWTFCTADIENDIASISDSLQQITNDTSKALSDLQKKFEENSLASYVVINDDDANNPFIELGTVVMNESNEPVSGEFKLRITKNAIYLMQNGEAVTHMDTESLHIKKAVIDEELSTGKFVLKEHGTMGNVGWIWKGGTS